MTTDARHRGYYVITQDDIGQPTIRAFDRIWLVSNQWGHTMQQDVGKRVYCAGNHLQIENDEQRNRRLMQSHPVHRATSPYLNKPTRSEAQAKADTGRA